MSGHDLNRNALSLADLAYIDEPGAAADKVVAAITAYVWALSQIELAEGDVFKGPSHAGWLTHRSSLPEVLR